MLMSPLLVSFLVFVAVASVIGVLAFVWGDSGNKTAERLDLFTGRKRKDDEATTILRKTAFDRDKKSLLEFLTPNLPSLQKLIVQADVHIRPSTLFGIGLVLGLIGATLSWLAGVNIYLAPLLGIVMLIVPSAWLRTKRAMDLKRSGC